MMASFLKDILLRHQQWEDETDLLSCKAESVNTTGSTSEKEGVEERCTTSASTHAEVLANSSASSQSTQAARPVEEPQRAEKRRYRTRPPRLRSSDVNVKASSCDELSRARSAVSFHGSSNAATERSTSGAPATVTNVDTQSQASLMTSSDTASPPTRASPTLPSPATTLALPFAPYPVQQEMCATLNDVLTSRRPHVVPVAVAEVPTGCGKTMALLSTVLRYQQELKRMTPKEAETYVQARRPPWQPSPANAQRKKRKKSAGNRAKPSEAGQRGAASSINNRNLMPGAINDVNDADSSDGDDDPAACAADAGWTVPRSFFKHFRVNSQRKIRAELDVNGSQELRRRFLPPPCTIYYATRTHAQLRQAVRELRRLHGAERGVRMNILGSRERYCVHPKVVQAKANHTLPVEGNNLGEVCDKLVSMGLCEMVDKYDELSCSAIGGSIGHQRGQIWDMEDLVLEGSARAMCPYYAARDLVFFADINFCTYQYLLDPLIRHETKMEAALHNNAIVVFDEAHNVSAVCQDALSLECPRSVLDVILSELEPLVANRHTLARHATTAVAATSAGADAGIDAAASVSSGAASGRNGDGFATLQYPRELHLGGYTLVEIFSFLHMLFRSISVFFDRITASGGSDGAVAEPCGEKRARETRREQRGEASDELFQQGAELEHHLRRDMEAFMRTLRKHEAPQSAQHRPGGRASASAPALTSLHLFQRAYGVIMSLGVTFNPFLFSIFGLSMLKRWLLLLRFLLQKPRSFVLTARSVTPADNELPLPQPEARRDVLAPTARLDSAGVSTSSPRGVVEIRCLDGSLAFNHLLQSVHRVVLASGTLAPFTQLAQDLGISATQWKTVEGLHVVPPSQYRLTALTALPTTAPPTNCAASTLPLRCTYASLSNPAFLKAVARCVVELTQTVQHGCGGGVLFFVPNYAVLHSLAKIARELLLMAAQASHAAPVPLFLEPRKAEALTQVLHDFQVHTQNARGGTALLFSVYRGKVSEGIDFTDEMARLVICLGVPLQPLKSWKVIAQRAYSGPEWYTTDAVRAVNQALGRCLRHVRDYGAVVLLDERYAHADFQQRLSRWCRTTLQTHASLSELCEALQSSFAQWRGAFGSGPQVMSAAATAIASAVNSDVVSQLSKSQSAGFGNDSAKDRLGTDQLPFQFVHRSPLHRTPDASRNTADPSVRCRATHGDTAMTRATSINATGAKVGNADCGAATRAGESLLQSPFACTAVKLLYETAHCTSDVSRHDLQAAIALLAETFAESDDNESSQE